jgi:hypothetical protein
MTYTSYDENRRVLAVHTEPAPAADAVVNESVGDGKPNPDGSETTTYYNASNQVVGVRTAPPPDAAK